MLPSDHRTVVVQAIVDLERKLNRTHEKEAEISEKLKQTSLGSLERLTLATRRIALAAKREASEIALVKLRSNMAPVRSLPIELLTEIFLLAVADQEEVRRSLHGQSLRLDYHWSEYNEYRMTLRTLTVQENISHVCQHWRDVSLAIPSLWQKLIFAVWETGENATQSFLNNSLIERMEVWMNRTKNVPLDVTFWSHLTPVGELWKAMRQFAHRFRSLRIYDQSVVTLQEIAGTLPPMPLLDTLHLGCLLKNENTMWKANLRFPQGIKYRLRELYLERVSLTWTQISLSRITKLVIMGRRAQMRIPYAQLNFILKAISPTLEWFAYQDQNRPNPTDDQYDSPIEFPILKTLEVAITDIRFLVHWLNAFSLPSLTRVYLDLQTETGTEFRSLTTAVKGRKSTPPEAKPRITFQKCEELTMGPCGKATTGIGDFIRTAFPALRKFHSHPEDSTFPIGEVFEALSANCPQLVEVQAYQCSFLEIHRLINTRLLNADITSLNIVHLDTVSDWSDPQIAWVSERANFLIGEGQGQPIDLMDYEDYGAEVMPQGNVFYGQPYTHVGGAHTRFLSLSDNDAEISSSSSSSSGNGNGNGDVGIEYDWR
jgi:hypothetical protein